MRLVESTSKGFTVVELVTVIVVLGILALGTTRFLGDATDGFAQTQSRTQLVADVEAGWLALARSLRGAVPGSVRTSPLGDCVEYLPIVAGTRYVNAPIGVSGDEVWTVPPVGYTFAANERLVVPQVQSVYALTNPGPTSPIATGTSLLADGRLRFTLGAPHQFGVASQRDRLYVVAAPESYCLDGGALYHYRNYGYVGAQPLPASLPSTLPDRVRTIAQISSVLPVFTYTPATLHRNAAVAVSLTVLRGGDQLDLEQIIHVRNVL